MGETAAWTGLLPGDAELAMTDLARDAL